MNHEEPADIQDMRIVHSALRRDLEHSRMLASEPALLTPPGDRFSARTSRG